MCLKTVTKLNLSKNAPLSVEMQKAVVVDQAVINDTEAQDVTYADNDQPVIDKAKERIRILIEEADKPEQLESIAEHVEPDQIDLFDSRMAELKTAKK
jgi:recombinational DNA repair protein RecT